MSSFWIFGFFVHNNLEAEAKRSYSHAALSYKTEREHARNSLGFYLRVIMNEKPINLEKRHLHLEKTTFSILSVLLLI